MAEVVIQEGESLENALRRFKRKVQQEDIIKEIKKHSFYMKPGEKRRTKQAFPASACARSRGASRTSRRSKQSGPWVFQSSFGTVGRRGFADSV